METLAFETPETELLPEPIEKIATRNMFYNEHGKHVRTKKEILDDSGNIRKGCKIPESVKLIVFICQSTIRLAKSKKCTLIMLNQSA